MTFLFLTRMTLRSRDLFFLVTFVLLASVFASAQLVEDPFCGYAPLCGSANVTIELSDDVPPDFPTTIGDAVLFGGAEIDLLDCCSLRDTAPVRDCEVVDPTGTGQRYATISQSLCDAFESVSGDENACDFGDCSNFAIILRPTFIGGNEPDGCCDTCSCYGDPQCTSFDGTKKMWRLCDGREVPPTGASWEHCRTTKDVCDTQKDHAGNTCAYLASNEDGKDWNLVKKGSPCVPNPLSPPSVIDMYSVPNADFGLNLTQGERGIILSLTLKLQMGTFRLSAVDCLTKHKNAWEFDEDEVDSTTLPPAFAYSKLVETEDIMWDIIDPHSGIAVNIRCYGNSAKGADVDDYPGGVYVPRLNVESLADPVARRRNTHGYCVTGDFDFGQATGMDRTDYIEENKLCIASLDMFPTLDIYRAICKNEALPESGIPDCVQNFCSRNYIPLFSSITQCVNTMKTDLALGFCKSIVTKLADVDECLEQWNDLGPVETVEQYYNDLALCVPFADLKASPGDCENGVQIQYLKNSTNTWVDFLYIPDNYCGDGSDGTGQIVLSRCDHNELFTNKLRVVQGTGDVSCGPRFQCTAVSGFKQFFSFYRPPTPSPTPVPTLYPTPFPTVPPVCEVTLCETPDNYVEINPDNEMLHTKLNGCCVRPPEEVCPEGVIPTIITRSEGSNMSFCGNKYPYSPPYKSSCKSKDKLDLKVMFFREENVTCCETCTCYGDPRCLSFDGTYEEFILCDGRDLPLNNNTEDRCVIRRDQCLKQKDHAANSCTWSNVKADVPDFSDPVQQALAEEKFSVGLYGSPCQANQTLSGRSLVKMYQTDDFELIAVQEERGYIFELNFTTARGKYHIDAPNCNSGFDIEVIEKYSPLDDFYVKERFGLEARWIFTDMTTNIEVKFRCTGVENDGRISLPFINVDRLMEPNQTRAERGNGFCSTNHMEGREKSTWQHSETLRQLGVCTSYNLYTTPIILRNSGRAITINPGLSTLGAEWAFTEYCNERYKQGFSTPAKCVKAFMSSKTVVDVFNAFCKTATDKQITCVNELKAWDITIGYQKGLELSRKKYLETYDQLCSVKPDDHRLNFVADSIGCKPGVELQYHHPTNGWITYKGFPINQAPCNGFEVEFLYKDHKPLFEYPVRLLQSYFPRKCSACDYVSTVDGWFTFSNA